MAMRNRLSNIRRCHFCWWHNGD